MPGIEVLNPASASGTAGGDLEGTYPNPTLKENSVGTAEIENAAVKTAEIEAGAITAGLLASEAVVAAAVKKEAIETAKIKLLAVTEALLATAVQNKLLTLEAPTALTTRAEATEFEVSATKAAIVTGHFEGATLTRTKIQILIGATPIAEAVISAANTGVTAMPICFPVAAGAKWQWKKIEGTIESFKTSYTVL